MYFNEILVNHKSARDHKSARFWSQIGTRSQIGTFFTVRERETHSPFWRVHSSRGEVRLFEADV